MSTPGNSDPGAAGCSSRPVEDDAGCSSRPAKVDRLNNELEQSYLMFHCTPDDAAGDEMEEGDDDDDEEEEDDASSDDAEQRKQRLLLAAADSNADEDYGGEDDDTTDGHETSTPGDGKKVRAPRKGRAPSKLGTKREIVKEVNPASGLPTLPEDLKSSYPGQIGAILRETANINDTNIRHKLKTSQSALLIQKLHERYEFPHPYNNLSLTNNIVNTQALIKFSKALSSWKTRLRGFVDNKVPWAVITKKFPTVSLEDFKKFLENEDRSKMKDLRKWGKEMRDKNLGNHHLGSRGYEGAKKRWRKEDQELAAAGKPNPYDKYHDPKAKQYIRSRYYFDANGNLVTSKKVQTLEKTLLVRIYRKILTLISIIFSRYIVPAVLNGSLASRRKNKPRTHPPRHRRRPSRGTSLLNGR
jgi:hypothetical protein